VALTLRHGLSSLRNLLLLRFSVACESPLLIFTTCGHVIKIDKECKITFAPCVHASVMPDDATRVIDDSKFTEFKPRQNCDSHGKCKGISFFESLKLSACNFCRWKILSRKRKRRNLYRIYMRYWDANNYEKKKKLIYIINIYIYI